MSKQAESRPGIEQFLTFRLGAQDFGVRIQQVQGIQGWDKVTPIPEMPAHVLGVIDLRGTVVPIIDLRKRLGFKRCDFNATTVVVVVKVAVEGLEKTFGLVVDAVSEVCDIAGEHRKQRPDFGSGVRAEFVLELATIKERMIILLDLDRLMNDSNFDVDATQDDLEADVAAEASLKAADAPAAASLDIEAIEQSFALLAPRADELVARFYDELFKRYPDVRPMFANADMAEQRKKLLAAIKLVVANLRAPETLAKALAGLGARHETLGAQPAHYGAVAATLLDVMAELAADAWTDRLATAWQKALEAVASGMLAGYANGSAKSLAA